MNCTNCGAAMKLVEGRGHFVCEYCKTMHVTDSAGGDAVTVLGELSDQQCPVCHVNLISGVAGGFEVLYCHQCRGLLTTNGKFRDIVQTLRKSDATRDETPPPFDPSEYERQLDCPICHQPMEAHPYYGPGNVVIDTCGHCFVVWLDHGELGVLQRAPGK